jgi:uncharacterized protein
MKLVEDGRRSLVRFEVGEKLPDALVELARLRGWALASISGLGAVKDVVLGYYDLPERKYINHPVEGVVELVSMIGNLSLLDGNPLWHVHVSVADRKGNLKGGHLMALEVAVTVECWIDTSPRVVTRKRDEFTGLNLLDL